MIDKPRTTGERAPAYTGALPPRVCNICGSSAFGPGMGGRLRGDLPPLCSGCGSVERHRAARTIYEKLRPLSRWWRVLQFAPDQSVDPQWFAAYRPSVFGTPSGLDMLATGLPDAAFDVVISNHVLEHVPDYIAGLRETLRLVGSFGVVHCMVPAHSWGLDDWGFADPRKNEHYREFGADFAPAVQKALSGVNAIGIAAADPVTGAADMIHLFSRSIAPLIGIHRLLVRQGVPVIRFFSEADPPADGAAARLAAEADAAAKRGDWADAVERWGACIKFFSNDRALGEWLGVRAAGLQRLGRGAEAEADYRLLTAAFPSRKTGYLGLARLAEQRQDRPAAVAALDALIANSSGPPDPDWQVQRALAAEDLPGARAALQAAIAAAHTIHALEAAFLRVPVVLQGWARQAAWRDLDPRVDALWAADAGSGEAQSVDRARILQMRLKLALRDFDGFLERLDAVPDTACGPWLQDLRRVAKTLRSDRFPDFGADKIFAIGLSRTGAKSVSVALRQLGFNAVHYTNPFTEEILGVDDAFLFDGFSGLPASVIFESLYYLFPNARFIHTVRPMPAWVASCERHVRGDRSATAGVERARLHGALYDRYPDAAAACLAYEARVRQFVDAVDAARFLEFDVFAGDGWEKLCAFVGRPIPATSFPWENKVP